MKETYSEIILNKEQYDAHKEVVDRLLGFTPKLEKIDYVMIRTNYNITDEDREKFLLIESLPFAPRLCSEDIVGRLMIKSKLNLSFWGRLKYLFTNKI